MKYNKSNTGNKVEKTYEFISYQFNPPSCNELTLDSLSDQETNQDISGV